VLSPYPQLVAAGYRRYASYRQAALAGLTTNIEGCGTAVTVVAGVTLGIERAKERLRTFLSAINARGDMTLLLTTHDLPDVERLCRRVVVIGSDPLDRAGGGRVLVDDDLATLRTRFADNRCLVVELASPAAPLYGLHGVVDVTLEAQGLRQRLEFGTATTAADLITAVARRVELRDVGVDEPSIEDLVRTLHAR